MVITEAARAKQLKIWAVKSQANAVVNCILVFDGHEQGGNAIKEDCTWHVEESSDDIEPCLFLI